MFIKVDRGVYEKQNKNLTIFKKYSTRKRSLFSHIFAGKCLLICKFSNCNITPVQHEHAFVKYTTIA